VDHEADVVGEFEPDDLQQIAGMVGSDRKDFGWVCVGFEVDEGEGKGRSRTLLDTGD
jgi:hypothetical protein